MSRSATSVREKESSLYWFGSALTGPLWVCIDVDTTTGQLRPTFPNIHSRMCAGEDSKYSLYSNQIFNYFVTVIHAVKSLSIDTTELNAKMCIKSTAQKKQYINCPSQSTFKLFSKARSASHNET